MMIVSSCTTQSKVSKWMDKNPPKAAALCEQKFPIEETNDTTYIVDSAKLKQYEAEYEHLTNYINELLNTGCDTVTVEKVMEKITRIPSKPCETKVITRTVEDTRKLVILRDSVTQLYRINAKQEQRIDDLSAHRKWLAGIVALLAVFILRKQIAWLIKSFLL